MSYDVRGVLNQLVSHCMGLGVFSSVNQHEVKSAVRTGMAAAVWADRILPYPRGSGLESTTSRIVFTIRLYMPLVSASPDEVDPNMLEAVDILIDDLTGHFTLGGAVRAVDLLGESGDGLYAQAGYVDIDGTLHRCMDLHVPLLVNDTALQAP